jgi:hypothetical protein
MAGKGRPKGAPPTGGSWKKGQSGNPRGAKRLDELAEFRAALKKLIDPAKIAGILDDILVNGDDKDKLRAVEIYLDRMYGKPEQAQKVEISESSAVKVIYRLPDNGRG